MPSIGDLAVKMTLDSKGVTSGLQSTSNRIENFAKNLSGKSLGQVAGMGLAGGLGLAGKGLQAAGGKMGGVAGAGVGMVGKLASGAATLAGPIGLAVVAVGLLAGAMAGLAGAANPALYAQLTDAWDDLTAVIGRMFLPVLRGLIVLVRGIADFASMLTGGGSSMGAAAKQASFTSADAFAEKAYTGAFSSGGGGGVPDQQLNVQQQILDRLCLLSPVAAIARLITR